MGQRAGEGRGGEGRHNSEYTACTYTYKLYKSGVSVSSWPTLVLATTCGAQGAPTAELHT